MTKEALKAAVDRMTAWSEDRQDAAVELLLAMDAWGDEPYPVSKEDLDDLRAALRETETVPYEEVKALFNQYR